MDVVVEESDIFGFEVLDDEEVSILGDPVGERKGELDRIMNTSGVSLMVWLSVSEARSSLFRRNA